MLFVSVGLTAIDVSLCGPAVGEQSVLRSAAGEVVGVQIAVPGLVFGPVPNTALVTGAGASTTLWVKLTGCGSPPSSPIAAVTPRARVKRLPTAATTSMRR